MRTRSFPRLLLQILLFCDSSPWFPILIFDIGNIETRPTNQIPPPCLSTQKVTWPGWFSVQKANGRSPLAWDWMGSRKISRYRDSAVCVGQVHTGWPKCWREWRIWKSEWSASWTVCLFVVFCFGGWNGRGLLEGGGLGGRGRMTASPTGQFVLWIRT